MAVKSQVDKSVVDIKMDPAVVDGQLMYGSTLLFNCTFQIQGK
jgi:hypothetical protein